MNVSHLRGLSHISGLFIFHLICGIIQNLKTANRLGNPTRKIYDAVNQSPLSSPKIRIFHRPLVPNMAWVPPAYT